MTTGLLTKVVVGGVVLCGVCAPSFAADCTTDIAAANGMSAAVVSSINESMHGDHAKDWMKRTNVGVTFQHHWKPQYHIETVQPLGHFDEQSKHVIFTQDRIANESDFGTTLNVGLGYRVLNESETHLVGVNTFYDYGFKRHHARIGGGVEYFTGQNEFRANVYKGVSGEKEIDATNHIFEKVVDGYDVGYATTFKNARWARAYVEGYHWDFKHHDDQNGFKVGAELQVTPNISVDAGYNKSTHHSGDAYGKIMYTLGKTDFALFGGKHGDDSVSTVRSKMLDKVRRNNNIVVERYQKDAPTVQSDTVTFSVRVR